MKHSFFGFLCFAFAFSICAAHSVIQTRNGVQINDLYTNGLNVHDELQNLLLGLIPQVVENLSVNELETDTYILSWDKSTSAVDHYEVQIVDEDLGTTKLVKTKRSGIPLQGLNGPFTFKVRSCMRQCSEWATTLYTFPSIFRSLRFNSLACLVSEEISGFSDTMTIQFAFKLGDIPSNISNVVMAPFAYATASTLNGLLILIRSDEHTMNVQINAINSPLFSYIFEVGRWYQITVVVENAAVRATGYVNGLSIGSVTFPSTPAPITSPGVIILANEQDTVGGGYSPVNQFYGSLDEVYVWNRKLTANEIYHLVSSRYRSSTGLRVGNLPIPQTGLLAHWSFTGADLTTAGVAYPSASTRLTRGWYLAGSTQLSDIATADEAWLTANRAIRFTDPSEVVLSTVPFDFPTKDYTAQLWVKITEAYDREVCLLGYYTSQSANSAGIWLNAERKIYALHILGLSFTAHHPLPLGAWTHVAVVEEAQVDHSVSLSIYLNGTLAASAAFDGTPRGKSGTLALGQDFDCSPADGGCYSAGQAAGHLGAALDNIRIHSRALAPAEIANHMHTCGEWYAAEDPDLVMSYSFDSPATLEDDAVTLVVDESGHGYSLKASRTDVFVLEDSLPTGPCRSHLF